MHLAPMHASFAVDRFDGVVDALGREERKGRRPEKFKRMLTETKLGSIVDIAIGGAGEAACHEPIGLLLVDGLHDYASVVADFHALADRLAPGARVALHDYSDYFPGVRRFVDEIIASGGYQVVPHVQSLIVLACQDD